MGHALLGSFLTLPPRGNNLLLSAIWTLFRWRAVGGAAQRSAAAGRSIGAARLDVEQTSRDVHHVVRSPIRIYANEV